MISQLRVGLYSRYGLIGFSSCYQNNSISDDLHLPLGTCSVSFVLFLSVLCTCHPHITDCIEIRVSPFSKCFSLGTEHTIVKLGPKGCCCQQSRHDVSATRIYKNPCIKLEHMNAVVVTIELQDFRSSLLETRCLHQNKFDKTNWAPRS